MSYDNKHYQLSDILNNVFGACELDGFDGEVIVSSSPVRSNRRKKQYDIRQKVTYLIYFAVAELSYMLSHQPGIK